MIKTLSKIYQFSGKMQGTMKKAILFSVLHSLFDMMSFGALAMVFSGLTDGFTTSMIWMIFGITLASMLLKIYCSYISDFGKVQIGYFMCAEKRIHIGDRMKYMPMGYFNDHVHGANQHIRRLYPCSDYYYCYALYRLADRTDDFVRDSAFYMVHRPVTEKIGNGFATKTAGPGGPRF